jgi:branched-chain amino acid transport system substrate-binding protein
VLDTIGADPNNFAALGGQMPEGYSYSGWYWHSAFDNDRNQQFLDAYRSQYEDSNLVPIPSFTGGSSYAAPLVYREAIEAAGSTEPDDIIAEMEGLEFTGPRGTWTIDPESHQASAPTVVGRTSRSDEVPYDGVGLTETQTFTLDRSTATDLLSGSDLPPGV